MKSIYFLKNLESSKLSNLFKVIIFIFFGFIAINCGEDNTAQERATINKDRTAVNPAQRKDVIPAQERATINQDRTAVNPAQEKPEVDDFVLRNIDLPADYKPVKLARTVEKHQPILITPSYRQPIEEPRTPLPSYRQPIEEPRTPLPSYRQNEEDSILVFPNGNFTGLKISLTKLSNQMNRYSDFYGKRYYDFSFSERKPSLADRIFDRVFDPIFSFSTYNNMSFSGEDTEGVMEYTCEIYTKIAKEFICTISGTRLGSNRFFHLYLSDCESDKEDLSSPYRIKLQDIVYDPEQFESLKASLDLS